MCSKHMEHGPRRECHCCSDAGAVVSITATQKANYSSDQKKKVFKCFYVILISLLKLFLIVVHEYINQLCGQWICIFLTFLCVCVGGAFEWCCRGSEALT